MTEINWNNPASLHTLVCRPALPKDTPDVKELTRTIWNGHDYVPLVWNTWLTDPEGLLAVAEYGGRIIGLGKLTQLTENEWWLEGLRVHPDFQGRGIGSYLMKYLYEHWEQKAGGIVRLATANYNVSIQHLNDRFGFQKIGEFTEFSAPAIMGVESIEDTDFSPIQPGQAE
ncbi:MAG: GNAT family N-acetyltransferase, partial [Anaerolineales bacterium]|nr:GNAT family N-acetyltransferase [Anaerolineales bacterium]